MNPDYLTVANRIYVQNGLALNSTFESVARTYKSEVKNIDFTDTKKAAEVINKWVSKNIMLLPKTPIKLFINLYSNLLFDVLNSRELGMLK